MRGAFDVIVSMKNAFSFFRVLVPKRLRKEVYLFFLNRSIEKLPAREFLNQRLVSALAEAGMTRLLFVGTRPYNRSFYRECEAKGLRVWSVDIDSASARWGAPAGHMIGDVRQLDKLAGKLRFDAIIFNGMFGFGINSVEDATQTIRGLIRTLEPNGVLIVGWNPGLTPDFLAAGELRQMLSPTKLGAIPASTEFAPVGESQSFPHRYDILRAEIG